MGGNFFGGALALLYFLVFQICGCVLTSCFLKRERFFARVILGSTVGSVLFMWLPVLFAFLFDFTVLSHALAVINCHVKPEACSVTEGAKQACTTASGSSARKAVVNPMRRARRRCGFILFYPRKRYANLAAPSG